LGATVTGVEDTDLPSALIKREKLSQGWGLDSAKRSRYAAAQQVKTTLERKSRCERRRLTQKNKQK
jgi:hypothetical protein